MSWQILILISVLLYSVGMLLQRVIVKEDKSDPVAFAILFQVLVGVLIAVYGVLFQDMSLPAIKPLLPNLIVMIVLWSLANIFTFNALKVTEASTFSIIFSTRAIFTTLASTVLLREFLNSKQWVGALLILLGVVLASIKTKGLKFEKKEILSLLTAIAFGFANTNDRILLKSFNLYPYVAIAFILPGLATLLYKPTSILRMGTYFKRDVIGKLILVCCIYAASSLTFFQALQISSNSSQVVTISISGVVLTVLLSIVFLNERKFIGRKIAGAVASLIGMILVG